MVNEMICQEENKLSFVEAPYSKVKELPLKELSESADTLIIDAAELIRNPGSNVFNPITAFHLKYFIENELESELAKGYKNVVIFGAKLLFFDPNVLDEECCGMMSAMIERVREITAKNAVDTLLVDFDEVYGNIRNYDLRAVMKASAEMLFDAQEVKVMD